MFEKYKMHFVSSMHSSQANPVEFASHFSVNQFTAYEGEYYRSTKCDFEHCRQFARLHLYTAADVYSNFNFDCINDNPIKAKIVA